MAVPIDTEDSGTISRVFFERWISVFGPPVRLFSDLGKQFVSSVVRLLCSRVGTKKVFTSYYAPQTDGCGERFNATLCHDLAKFVTH